MWDLPGPGIDPCPALAGRFSTSEPPGRSRFLSFKDLNWDNQGETFSSFYSSIVHLQCCISFRYKAKWFSYILIYNIILYIVLYIRVRLFATPWTVAYQASPIGFSRQEYWSGLPFPSPEDLPHPGWNLGLQHCRRTLYCLSHQGSHILICNIILYYTSC